MKWHLTQIGAREAYIYPRLINKKGLLGTFSTDMWFKNINKLPLKGSLIRMKSRYHYDLHNFPVQARNFHSIYKMLNPYKGDKFDKWCSQGVSFGNWASKNIKNNGVNGNDIIFGYTNASLEIAKLAQQHGAKMILGQYDPGLYWYDVQKEEAIKWLGNTRLEAYTPNSRFKDRLLTEWDLADTILVNSTHSKQALIKYGVTEEKIKILPLSTSINIKDSTYYNKDLSNKIKILFVGNISFAKGFPYYAQAAHRLRNDKRFEFYAIGDVYIPDDILKKNSSNIIFTGRLNKQDLSRYYRDAHILVFPTLSEGFGQVQLESMAHGLPVIATRNCGDVVIDDLNGKLVDICNSEQIVNAILDITSNVSNYNAYSISAFYTTKEFSFEKFEQRFWELF